MAQGPLQVVWSGPVHLGDNPFISTDEYGGFTFEFPVTVWPGDHDGTGGPTLVVETDRGAHHHARVPVTVRYCPISDGVASPLIVLRSEVLDTDDDGRLSIPLDLTNLASRPIYYLAVRIEAPPLGDTFTVRRVLAPPSEGNPGVAFGFHGY
jgi:hypothetical protein